MPQQPTETAILTVGHLLSDFMREKLATADVKVTEYRQVGRPNTPTRFHLEGPPEVIAFITGVVEEYNAETNPPPPSWRERWRNRKAGRAAAATTTPPPSSATGSVTIGGFTTRAGAR